MSSDRRLHLVTSADSDILRDRFRGALLGLAAGDALGTTVEFRARGTFDQVTDIVGGGPFNLEPGQWTDDTSMALCLAVSLVERGGFDPLDQMERYARWSREGYLSSNGRCFDIGNTVGSAIARFERDPDRNPYAGSNDVRSAGNGSLMRLAPVPLSLFRSPSAAIAEASDSSRTTHGATSAVDACRYFAGLIVGCLHGATKEELLSPRYAPPGHAWPEGSLASEVETVASGSFRQKDESEIRATGYVVHTLEAALWAFANTSDFRDGCVLAVNLGDDADTVGAVYGQLAGAFYGASNIPGPWRERLTLADEIARLADALFELAMRRG